MAAPKVPALDLGGNRPASGDSARAAMVNPVSQMEANQRLRGGGPGAAFDGLAVLTGKAADFLKKQNIDRDQVMAVDAEGRYMRMNEEEIARLDPMSPDYSQQVKEIIKRNSDAVLADSRFSTREVQDETVRRFTRIGAAAELLAVESRRKSIAGEAERVYTQRLEELYGAIRKDPGGYETHVAAFQADAARLRTGITPDRLRIISHAAADGMLAAKVEGLAQRGDFAGARKFLDDNSGSFKPETNRMLRGVINSFEDKAQRNYALASTDAAARVRIEIIKQQDPDARITVTREDLDRQVKSGRIRPQDADSLYAALAVTDRARNTEIGLNRAAIANFDKGTLNGDDADRVFRIALGAATERRGTSREKVDTLNSPEALEALDIVAAKGVIPPMVSRQVENFANAGGPGSGDIDIANLAKAAAVYRAIKEKYPNAKWGFESNDRLALVLEQAKANGGDIAQAARDVMKNLPADKKVHVERMEMGREAARKINWEQEGRVVLGDWVTRQLSGAGSIARTTGRIATGSQITEALGLEKLNPAYIPPGRDAPEIPVQMLAEYRAGFERHFLLSNNVEMAKAAALEQIKNEWRVTYVGGAKTPYVMKHAPASFLPPERSWLRDDLDKIMSDATEKLLKTQGWKPPADDVRGKQPVFILEADTRTLSEAAARRPITYQVKVLREDRLYHTAGRVAMPTDDDLKSLPQYKDRMRDYTESNEAREAREAIERQAQERANKRRR